MTQPDQGIIVRPMTLDDIPQVYQIEIDSFTLPWPLRSYIFELTESKISRCYVAESIGEVGGKILGMIVIYQIEDESHVATFAVHKDHRREGVGVRIILHALKQALKDGSTHAFLEVRASNCPAINLYERLGFVTVNIRKKYYADNNEDALLMNLDGLTMEKLNELEMRLIHSIPEFPTRGPHDN